MRVASFPTVVAIVGLAQPISSVAPPIEQRLWSFVSLKRKVFFFWWCAMHIAYIRQFLAIWGAPRLRHRCCRWCFCCCCLIRSCCSWWCYRSLSILLSSLLLLLFFFEYFWHGLDCRSVCPMFSSSSSSSFLISGLCFTWFKNIAKQQPFQSLPPTISDRPTDLLRLIHPSFCPSHTLWHHHLCLCPFALFPQRTQRNRFDRWIYLYLYINLSLFLSLSSTWRCPHLFLFVFQLVLLWFSMRISQFRENSFPDKVRP